MAALDLVHFDDDQGRATPLERSVGYRFGMVSFWRALAYADILVTRAVDVGNGQGHCAATFAVVANAEGHVDLQWDSIVWILVSY